MSKALSANIHDPNHTVDEYDLYFNGEPVTSGGGGSGDHEYTLIASGSVVGTGSSTVNINVGKKMASTDFIFKLKSKSEEYEITTQYKFLGIESLVSKDECHFNLYAETEASGIFIRDAELSVGDTTVKWGQPLGACATVVNNTVTYPGLSKFSIFRENDSYKIVAGISNPVYEFVDGVEYDWEVIYIGSDPATDIIEITEV